VSNSILEAKLAALQGMQERLNAQAKKAGKPSVMLGADEFDAVPRMATGSVGLDIRLKGGWPIGSQVEIYGKFSSGKSTLCYQTAAELMRRDPSAVVLLIDAEGSFDPDRAELMGWDKARYKKLTPETLEEAVVLIEEAAKLDDGSGKSMVSLVIVDSLAMLPTAAEMSGEITDQLMADKARVMSRAMARINGLCRASSLTVLWINQVRTKAGFTMGNPEYTPGGDALKFAVWTRVQTFKRDPVKDEKGEQIAQITRIKIEKNKGSGALGESFVQINQVNGLDLGFDLFTTGQAVGLVRKLPAAFFSVQLPSGELKVKGKDNFIAALNEHPERFWLYDEIVKAGMAQKGAVPAIQPDADVDAAFAADAGPDLGVVEAIAGPVEEQKAAA
jgi:recombination protein RecA